MYAYYALRIIIKFAHKFHSIYVGLCIYIYIIYIYQYYYIVV